MRFAIGLIILSKIMALFVGVGLSFIHPILEVAQADREVTEAPGIPARFIDFYNLLGILFTLEFLTLGVAGKMSVS